MKRFVLICGAGLLALVVILLGFYLIFPNDIDNALGWKRGTMIDCTLKWDQLAPFPKNATDFEIQTKGGSFTRTFRGSFSATPEAIQSWLKKSLGVLQGEKETLPGSSTKYILKTGEGAGYGELIVSPDQTHVSFMAEWS